MTRDDFWRTISAADFSLKWLAENTGCVSAWYRFMVSQKDMTNNQRETLLKLKDKNLIEFEV